MGVWLPEIEGWVKVAGVLVGVVMAVLVPVRSWITEDRRYRAQMMEAAASAGRTVTGALSGPLIPPAGGALCGVVGTEGLIAAVRDCAAAIRESTQAEQLRGNDRLTQALNRFVDRA